MGFFVSLIVVVAVIHFLPAPKPGRTRVGSRKIGFGVAIILMSDLVLLMAQFVFSFSMSIDLPPGDPRLPRFEPGPWVLGCGLLAVGGVALTVSGLRDRHRAQRAATPEPAEPTPLSPEALPSA